MTERGKMCTVKATAVGRLQAELDEAERKAWDSLARYKFQMFGYYCAIWVHLNRISRENRANPWRDLVLLARKQLSDWRVNAS